MIKHIALIALGFLLLIIGAIGIFIPIWPTTPFVLLAAGCFSVNPRLQTQLMRIKFFRDHATNYRKRTGLPKGNVICSLSFLWAVLTVSALVNQTLLGTILLVSVGIAVTVHLLCMARPKKAPSSAFEKANLARLHE